MNTWRGGWSRAWAHVNLWGNMMRLQVLSAAAAALVLGLPAADASARCGKCGNATLVFVNETGQSIRIATVSKKRPKRGENRYARTGSVKLKPFVVHATPVTKSARLYKRLCSNKGIFLEAAASGLHKLQPKNNNAQWKNELDAKLFTQKNTDVWAKVTGGRAFYRSDGGDQGDCASTYTFTFKKLD